MLERRPETRSHLSVRKLNAFYGESHVLHDLSFDLAEGQIVTLLGRNGAGKSTTLKAIMGMLRGVGGSILFKGQELVGKRSFEIGRLGLAYCPEERGIFASLNVRENLMLPPVVADGGLPAQKLDALFPNLRERWRTQGTRLSGGEQQMLAIARILRTGARCLLLDEPTEGLAPAIVQQIRDAVAELKEAKFTILLVEQNIGFAKSLADRHYVIENGAVVDCIASSEMDTGSTRLERYLSV
ncbi:MAG: ABC transporter ATP-binding protein [Terriglobia bacterium]